MSEDPDLLAFRSQVVEMDPAESALVRRQFVESFVDREIPEYAERIGTLRLFTDGMAYTGYLWDFLKAPTVLDEEELWRKVRGHDRLLIMWDLHTADLIRIPDYWKFGKTSVLQGTSADAYEGRRFLPDDLYLFDRTYRWVGVLTHEYVEDRRHCLWQENKIGLAHRV